MTGTRRRAPAATQLSQGSFGAHPLVCHGSSELGEAPEVPQQDQGSSPVNRKASLRRRGERGGACQSRQKGSWPNAASGLVQAKRTAMPGRVVVLAALQAMEENGDQFAGDVPHRDVATHPPGADA